MYNDDILNIREPLPAALATSVPWTGRPDAGLYDITFADQIRPAWLGADERARLPLQGVVRATHGLRRGGVDGAFNNMIARGGDDVLAWARRGRDRYPLIAGQPGARCVLHFDPEATFEFILHEKYRRAARPLPARLPFAYRDLPADIRHAASRVITPATVLLNKDKFPNYPVEKSLESVRHALRVCAGLHADADGLRVILTHDVDDTASLPGIEPLARAETELGLTSVWFVTAKVLSKQKNIFTQLMEQGHEIGLHGFNHDLKFAFLDEPAMRARLRDAAPLLREFRIRGFRSPFYIRSMRLLRALADYFAYDSSIPDADAFTGAAGGCALVRPFRVGRLIELPVTLPFEIPLLCGAPPARLVDFWQNKIEFARDAGGTLVVNTHPDAHAAGRADVRRAYLSLIENLKNIGAEFVLPGEIF